MTPKYQQIVDALRAPIERGDPGSTPGSPFPTMKAIAATYSTADMTARRAMEELRDQGLIVRDGNGYVVRGPASPIRQRANPGLPGQLDDWTVDVRSQDRGDPTTSLSVQIPASTDVPARVLGHLKVRDIPGQLVVRRTIRYINRRPTQIADLYIPVDIAQGTPLMAPEDLQPTVLAELARLGHPVVLIRDEVDLRTIGDVEAATLGLDRRTTVQEITRIGFGADGAAVCAQVLVYGPGEYLRVADFPLPDTPG